MSALRVYEVGLDAAPAVRLRVYEVGLDAAIPLQPRLRVYEVELDSVGAVVVGDLPDITIGPGEEVEIEAELLTGGSATWAWRRVSGPPVTIAADGATATITGPSRWNADVTKPTSGVPGISKVVIGVTATVAGQSSVEVRFEVSILPQLSWSYGGPILGWVGAAVAPA